MIMYSIYYGLVTSLLIWSSQSTAHQTIQPLPKKLLLSATEDNVSSLVASQVLSKAYEKLGVDLEYAFLPASRALKLSSSGRTDGEVGRIEDIEKAQRNLIKINIPVYFSTASIFSMNKELIEDVSDISGSNIACVRGIRMTELKVSDLELKCIYVLNHEHALNMLKRNRVEFLIGSKNSVKRLMNEQDSQLIKVVYENFYQVKLYHFLHKKNAQLVQPITQILSEMERNGEIKNVVNAFYENL